MKMKKMTAAICLILLVPAMALGEIIVETPDGFRRAAENEAGYSLLMMQENKEVDGLAVNVGMRLTLSDPEGNPVWAQIIGGDGDDMLAQALPAGDGWFAVGASSSADLDNGWHEGWYDVYEPRTDGWVVMLNSQGIPLWTRCLGGTDTDAFYGVCEAADGGWIVVGETYSSDGDVRGWHDSGELFRQPDAWVLHLGGEGEIIWQRALGGSGFDRLRGVVPVEGGYLCVGQTDSEDGDVTGLHGDRDGWVVLLNEAGELVSQFCYGGEREDDLWAIAKGERGILAVGNGWHGNRGEGERLYNSHVWALSLLETGDLRWGMLFGVDEDHHARYVAGGDPWQVAGFTQMPGYEYHWVVEVAPGGTSWQVVQGEMPPGKD